MRKPKIGLFIIVLLFALTGSTAYAEKDSIVKSKAEQVYKNDKDFWEAQLDYGIKMIYIPPGEFTMGQSDEEKTWLLTKIEKKEYDKFHKSERPPHKVFLEGYWIAKTELTKAQFAGFVKDSNYRTEAEKNGGTFAWNGKKWQKNEAATWRKNPHFPQENNHPVVGVSWNDANEYCKWLSVKTGLVFKLPTEAQWERAARGIYYRIYPWGNDPLSGKHANSGDKNSFVPWRNKTLDDGFKFTAPVGSFPAGMSPYGLMDMAGNVWEWCRDRYSAGYYTQSPDKNPEGPTESAGRTLRGCSWYGDFKCLRCSQRDGLPASYSDYGLGFRIVLIAEGIKD